jgi:hypothetical protein
MFKAVTQKNPCAICGKPSWCSRTADGKTLLCRRVSLGGIRKVDKSGCEYFLHFTEKQVSRK